MKNNFSCVKLISLLLVLSIFILSFTGCSKDKGDPDTSSINSDTSSINSDTSSINSDTSSSNESSDSNTESKEDVNDDTHNSEDSIDTDINLDLDFNVDTDSDSSSIDDFEIDLKVYQTVKFDNVSEQKNYAGMTGILPCWWFLPDNTLEQPYTEKQLEISIKKFLQMGVTIVRCNSIEPAMAWDAENDKWDWNSEYMKGFYKYCELMKENNIEIIWNPTEVSYNSRTVLALEEPFQVIGKQQYPEIFSSYKNSSPTDEQKEIMLKLYGDWVVDFFEEAVIKRGFDNIKYFEPGTEPNNGTDDWTDEQIREDYESWVKVISSAHNAMEKAGYRDKIKFVGPSAAIPYRSDPTTIKSAYMWLEWCVNEIDYMIDIYAVHQYWRPQDQTQDFTENFHKLYLDPCKKLVEPTGKPLWCDEFNADDAAYTGTLTTRENPLQATQLALGYLQHMINGIQATPIWYLVDIKWPNESKTSTDNWEEGIHKCGVDVSVLESTIPSNGYYVYCMLGQTVRKGDIVYEGKSELGGVYSVMLKHTDGTYSFISVNLGWEENEITYKLPVNLKSCTYEKTVYDPMTFKATTQYRPIEPSKEIKNVTNSFTDKIGAYQVCVYNLK